MTSFVPTITVTQPYGGGGAAYTRATATATTSSLANNASDSTTTMPLAIGYVLYDIQTSRPARVRLYNTATQKTADASRAAGTDPASSSGLVLDFVTPTTAGAYSLNPAVVGASLEISPSANIAMNVTNVSGTTGTVTVTLVWLRIE